MFRDAPITSWERHQLADIHPDARDAFYRRITVWWYTRIAMGIGIASIYEYLAFQFVSLTLTGFLSAFGLLAFATVFRKIRYNRNSDHGALAAAKLAENPHKSCEYRRNTTKEERLESVTGTHIEDFEAGQTRRWPFPR